MEHQFGHGFVTSIMLIAMHVALPPVQAWPGAGDHVAGLVLPDTFRDTEVAELTTLLKKKVVWHQPGSMDREDAREVIATLRRLVVAIDREPGIPDVDCGAYNEREIQKLDYKTPMQIMKEKSTHG
jgi:hypothetical protein